MTRLSPDFDPSQLRRMRGPSPQKTELTRSEILSAAIAEFLDVGIAKATMDKIAKRAHLAKGTLYLHFASKEELLMGALEMNFAESALPIRHTPRLPDETVQAYIGRLVVPSMENLRNSVRTDLARLILGEAKRYPALGAFYYDKIYAPWQAHFASLFQCAIDEGELQGIAPAAAAMLIGAPFWISLVHDTIGAPIQQGCTSGELMRSQIDAIFGRYRPSEAK